MVGEAGVSYVAPVVHIAAVWFVTGKNWSAAALPVADVEMLPEERLAEEVRRRFGR